jgi:hypothetical protein
MILETSELRWTLIVVSIVFGIIPATFLVMVMLIVAADLAETFPWTGEFLRAISLLVFFSLSILGYLALWFALGRQVRLRVAVGLAIGTACACVALFLSRGEEGISPTAIAYLYGGPIAIGGLHLARWGRQYMDGASD